MTRLASLALVLLAVAPVAAQPVEPAPQPQPQPPPVEEPKQPEPDPQPDPQIAVLKTRMQELEARLQATEDELAATKDDTTFLEEKLTSLLPLQGKIGGYLDVGFFAVSGNGAGTRSDLIGLYFPEYVGIIDESWIFMGDPLSTTINSRGDVADTGDSRAVVYDPINTEGKPTFLVNALNLAVFGGIGETGSVTASVDFLPRARDASDASGLFLGDHLDVKLAYGEWKPTFETFDLSLQVGKFDSVLGFEYRSIESPDRTGVTPSLICRYTCGRPVGIKARGQFFEKQLVLNVAVTNGSHFSEQFPFASESDTNDMKTVAGRLSYVHEGKGELGVSGAFGAQDFQPQNDVYQWHVGVDLHVDVNDIELTAEYVQGKATGVSSGVTGAACDDAPCLDYKGAYGQVAYRATNTFIPYLRVDWRDALHLSGTSFVYISQLVRGTVGLRAEIGERVIVKIEGTKNRELGRLPQFPNDVVTSSLVLKY